MVSMSKSAAIPMKRAVWRNFCYVFIFFLIVTLFIAVFMYSHAKTTLETELLKSNEDLAAGYAEQMDDFFISLNRLNATLAVNQPINSYIASPRLSPVIFSGLRESIRSQLETTVYASEYIESIYVVSIADDQYISKEGYRALSALDAEDGGWRDMLSDELVPGVPAVFTRKVNHIYPYVLSYVTPVASGENIGYIIVNVNVKYFPSLTQQRRSDVLSSYVITEDGQLLCRAMKRDLLEPLSCVPELESFRPGEDARSCLVNGSEPYAYTQIYSPAQRYYYVTVTRLTEYTQSLSTQQRFLAAFSCALLLMFALAAIFLCLRAQKPIRSLLTLLENPKSMAYQADYSTLEIKQIAERFVRYIQANTALSEELKAQMEVLSDVRLWALQSQINPHFIFNTLNLIHCECVQAFGYRNAASDLILKFSKLIHYALYSNHLVPLEQEISYTKIFADILCRRYGDSIQIAIEIPHDCLNAMVPKLLFQPLIENSAQHGADFAHGRTLHVAVRAARVEPAVPSGETVIRFTVEDDGTGIAPEELETLRHRLREYDRNGKSSIGLSNVAARLRLLYPEESNVTIESTLHAGTRVSIEFPYAASRFADE